MKKPFERYDLKRKVETMYIKAKDLRAGMVIELTMKASYHSRKKMVTQKVKIEEDVFYNTSDEEVLVDFVECETGKGGVIMLPSENKYKRIK